MCVRAVRFFLASGYQVERGVLGKIKGTCMIFLRGFSHDISEHIAYISIRQARIYTYDLELLYMTV